MQHTPVLQTTRVVNAPVAEPHVLLGRYRVLETNTEGGFGCVNVCWDSRLQRRVAIKQMPLLLNVQDASIQISTVDEALAEARTSSMLAHPNIVTMFDFETDGQYSYLVMEYVDGLSLADLLARVEDGVLSFDECAHVVDSVASALSYAHENGVLHLDIKPANIMIDRSGTVKLADFGMATLASAAGYGDARGGTVGYMPPEQIEGSMVDERTDVFSLAVVVWQALSGSCPFAARSPEESLALINRGPNPLLSRTEPQLAGTVENTLLQALDPDPRARMASVQTFAHHLVRALGNTEDGADSLMDLLNQTEEDEEPRPLQDWERLRVPLTARHPGLIGATSRLMAALSCGWVTYQAIPFILPNSSNALLFGTGGVAVACAIWPPLAGILGMVVLVGALLAQLASAAIVMTVLAIIVGTLWWVAAGRTSAFAGSTLLLPACLASPLAGVGLAGVTLAPSAALLTGVCSYLYGIVTTRAMANGFYADYLAQDLMAMAGSPRTWIVMAGCGVAAFVCSLLSRRRSVVLGMVGQFVALAILICSYLVCAHVENDSIAAALDIPSLVVAVILGTTLCIATALVGQGRHQPEG